jgi:hypothetical protein
MVIKWKSKLQRISRATGLDVLDWLQLVMGRIK